MPELRSGVDIEKNSRCSALAHDWARKSFLNRQGRAGAPLNNSSGSFSNYMDYGGAIIAMTSDGIGSKIELAERLGRYDSLGFDLMAMVTDDLVANGFEPGNVSNILDVDALDAAIVDDLMRGLFEAATAAEVAVTGGEIAELGDRVSGWGPRMHFNWCATAIGSLPQTRQPIEGGQVRPGQHVVAIESPGFRSNGFSLLRSIMARSFGPLWHEAAWADGRTWGEILLTPSVIYAPAVCKVLDRGCRVTGIAHITGGGIPDKLGRVLRRTGCGARLPDLFEPLPFMLEVARLGEISPETAYHQWNQGNGMLLLIEAADAAACIALLGANGLRARHAGLVTDDAVITIAARPDRREVLAFAVGPA
jgi:phosphoribosylformylglycinamidine cyclo-ligase